MGIEELKASVGVGGAKLEIYIPKPNYKLDESLNGKVLLLGGKVKQEISVLDICLIREWSWEVYGVGRDLDFWGVGGGAESTMSISAQGEYERDEDKGTDEIFRIELATDFRVRAGDKKEFPFRFNLSSIQKEKGVNEKWKLQARAYIIFAKDATAQKEINLIIPSKATK